MRKEISHGTRYDERELHEPMPAQYLQEECQLPKETADSFQAAMRVVLEADIDEEIRDLFQALRK